jgi:hypothetical protein
MKTFILVGLLSAFILSSEKANPEASPVLAQSVRTRESSCWSDLEERVELAFTRFLARSRDDDEVANKREEIKKKPIAATVHSSSVALSETPEEGERKPALSG